MLVLGINKILKWCQVLAGGRTYTCRTREINGKLFFKFKNVWHPVAQFVADHAEELVQEGGRILSRPFKKQKLKKEGINIWDYLIYLTLQKLITVLR